MARPLRLEFPGALYHVTSRGDRQEPIYLGDSDRRAWLRILAATCARFNWLIHAYCQMGNHYHLVVETLDGNLSRGMRQLNGDYARWFNFHHTVVGHLFQGRYHAILIQRDSYLLALSRYVVLNPVRGGIVATPHAWPWSSYLMTTGTVAAPIWLDTAWILSQFADEGSAAIHAYREFVAAGRGLPSPLRHTRHQLVLGDADFEKQCAAGGALIDKTETARTQKKGVALTLLEYGSGCSDPREAMARAYLSGAYTMLEVAQHFSVHYRTVSRAVHTFEGRNCPVVRPDPGNLSVCQT